MAAATRQLAASLVPRTLCHWNLLARSVSEDFPAQLGDASSLTLRARVSSSLTATRTAPEPDRESVQNSARVLGLALLRDTASAILRGTSRAQPSMARHTGTALPCFPPARALRRLEPAAAGPGYGSASGLVEIPAVSSYRRRCAISLGRDTDRTAATRPVHRRSFPRASIRVRKVAESQNADRYNNPLETCMQRHPTNAIEVTHEGSWRRRADLPNWFRERRMGRGL